MDDLHGKALEALRGTAELKKRTGKVPFPPWAIAAEDGKPPLAGLVQGGRGGHIRLPLYMNIVMMATMAPYDIRNPPTPSSWARLLGLPPDSGPRRINYNLKLIEEQGLITLTPRPARPPLIKLRDPRPGSQAYSPRKGRYVGIPIEFWTQGWILELPPTAIALLLVLEDVTGGYTGPRYVPRHRRSTYGLSADTWTRGRKKLELYGILSVEREPFGSDFDYRRMRNAYKLDWELVKGAPPQIPR